MTPANSSSTVPLLRGIFTRRKFNSLARLSLILCLLTTALMAYSFHRMEEVGCFVGRQGMAASVGTGLLNLGESRGFPFERRVWWDRARASDQPKGYTRSLRHVFGIEYQAWHWDQVIRTSDGRIQAIGGGPANIWSQVSGRRIIIPIILPAAIFAIIPLAWLMESLPRRTRKFYFRFSIIACILSGLLLARSGFAANFVRLTPELYLQLARGELSLVAEPTVTPGWISSFPLYMARDYSHDPNVFTLPLWWALVGFMALAWFIVRPMVQRPKPGACKACGYDLRGNVSGVCPECGTAFMPEDSACASRSQ